MTKATTQTRTGNPNHERIPMLYLLPFLAVYALACLPLVYEMWLAEKRAREGDPTDAELDAMTAEERRRLESYGRVCELVQRERSEP